MKLTTQIFSNLGKKQPLIEWQDIIIDSITINANSNGYYDVTVSDVGTGQNIFDALVSPLSWEIVGKLDSFPSGNRIRIIFYNPTDTEITTNVKVRAFYY